MDFSSDHRLSYFHVDVFSRKALSGNGCTVFLEIADLSTALLQQLTQEMRQFESIFLSRPQGQRVRARIFTMQEELGFAGHPILAAAAVLDRVYGAGQPWIFELKDKAVTVSVSRQGAYMQATMDQGSVSFGSSIAPEAASPLLRLIGLETSHRCGCWVVRWQSWRTAS